MKLRWHLIFSLLISVVGCLQMAQASPYLCKIDSLKPVQDSSLVPGSIAYMVDIGQKIELAHFTPGNRYNPYQLIQSKIPGVLISRPGGDPNAPFVVQVRGLHSAIYQGLSGFPTTNGYNSQINNTQALVVVDGIPGVALQTVDPQDIVSIEILRDAATLAIYGMRGANGVVRIQTKRATVESRGLEYSTYFALDQAQNPYASIDAAAFRRLTGSGGKYQGATPDLGANTDWYAQLTRGGFSQAHNLALSGAGNTSAYRLAVNYREVNSIAKKSGFDQLSALFNFQKQFGKLKIDGLLGISNRNTSEVTPDIFRNAAIMNPTAPIRVDTARSTGGYYQPNRFALFNPVALLEQTTIENNFQDLTTGLNGEWELMRGLKALANLGFQRNQEGLGWALAEGHIAFRPGSATWEARNLNHWYLNGALQYEWHKNKHNFQSSLGYTYQRWDGDGVLRNAKTFNNQSPDYKVLITNEWQERNWQVEESDYRESDDMPAVHWQGEYTFNQRWFAKGSLRREGFTRLGQDKWVTYPALTLGGMLIQQGKVLNALKLQIGYGVTGNIPPKTYATELLVLPGGTPTFVNGEFKPGIYYPFTPNPNLRAERRSELNVALDFAMFNQRVQGQIQVYQSRSEDLLWQSYLPGNNTFSNIYFDNLMALENRGVELQLNVTAVQTRDLHWQSNLSASHNQTVFASTFPKVNEFDNPNQLRLGNVGSPGYCCGAVQVVESQGPIGQFYTVRSDGIGNNGQWKNLDLNKDGFVNEQDQTYTGNAQPALLLGWDNTLNWKRFSLNVFWRGVLGHDQMNIFNLFYANPNTLLSISQNIPEVALSGDFSRLESSFNPISDYFVENSSFLRLENLSLGYDLPFANPQKKRKLNLYLSTQNLLTITGFSGNDPELHLTNLNSPLMPGMVNPNYFSLSRNLTGVDRGRYPLTRSLVFGARLKL